MNVLIDNGGNGGSNEDDYDDDDDYAMIDTAEMTFSLVERNSFNWI